MGSILSWVGGGLRTASATGLVVGFFFMSTGLLPWEYAVELITNPPYWLTNGFTRVMLIILGLVIIYVSLRWNIWSKKQEVIDELSEELKWAINNLLNRSVTREAELARVKSDINSWCDKISKKLENRAFFTKADQIHFDYLGRVPNTIWDIAWRPSPVDTRHDHELDMLNLKFERLRDVINWTQQRVR